MKPTLIYATDPMCSWCYGFAPQLDAVLEAYRDHVALDVLVGGLRPDQNEPVPESFQAQIRHHWQEVHRMAARPFAWDFFERHPGFAYNTAPACRATVAMRRLRDDHGTALQYQHALQQRFYAQGQDPTRIETFAAAAEDCDTDPEQLLAVYHDPDTETETRADFARARRLGVQGYPSLLLSDGTRTRFLTAGWQPAAALKRLLARVLERLDETPSTQSA